MIWMTFWLLQRKEVMMTDQRMACRKVLLEFLTKKLFFLAGLRQVDKMSKQEIADWLNVMEYVYKPKHWVDADHLSIILTRGCMGHYGDFNSLNAKVLGSWIEQYYRDNRNDIDQTMKRVQNQVVQADIDKKVFYFKLGRERLFETIKSLEAIKPISHHQFPENLDPGNLWFKYLEAVGLIHQEGEGWLQACKIAHLRISQILNRGSEFIVTIPSHGVVSEAKIIMLKNLLTKWINDGEDIEAIFEEYGVFDEREKDFFGEKVK